MTLAVPRSRPWDLTLACVFVSMSLGRLVPCVCIKIRKQFQISMFTLHLVVRRCMCQASWLSEHWDFQRAIWYPTLCQFWVPELGPSHLTLLTASSPQPTLEIFYTVPLARLRRATEHWLIHGVEVRSQQQGCFPCWVQGRAAPSTLGLFPILCGGQQSLLTLVW